MKKDKYILSFYILSVVTFIISSFYSLYISYAFETILLLYSLFYVMNIYKGKSKKPILLYLFLVVLSLLCYTFLVKDSNLLLSILNLGIIPIFIFTYHSDRGLVKFKVMELFKILALILPVLFLITNDSRLCFAIVLVTPYIFMDRGDGIKDLILQIIVIALILLTRFLLLIYPMLFYLFVVAIYRLSKKDKQAFLKYILIGIISVCLLPVLNVYSLGIYNSDVFGSELFILKVFKLVIAILPLVVISIKVLLNFINYKLKLNYEMIISLLSVLGFGYLTFVLRLDYSQFIILIGSLSLFIFNKFMIDEKKIDENKITIITDDLSYNGVSKYISCITKMFNKNKIDIISTYKVHNEPAFVYGSSNVIYLMKHGPNKNKVDEAIENLNIFRIITEGFKYLMSFVNSKAYLLERLIEFDSKYVITTNYVYSTYIGDYLDNRFVKIATEHFYHNDDEGYIRKVVTSVKRCNYLVCVSPDLEDFYKKKVNKRCKVIYIPNVIDESSKKKVKYGSHNLISVGRLSSEKGQKDLIDVIEILKDEYEDIHLDIVGDGPLQKELRKYISSKKLNKYITIQGFRSSEEIEKMSLASSVFVMTSFSESFGLALIEAQNYSMPVVAFDTASGVKYLLKNGSGILVKNRNIKEMAKEIDSLLSSKSLFNKYSSASKENANNYLIKNVKPMWDNIIK